MVCRGWIAGWRWGAACARVIRREERGRCDLFENLV
jgi:hypothetical protein